MTSSRVSHDVRFARHAPVSTDVSGTCYGHHDVSLTHDAAAAASVIAGRLGEACMIHTVHTSPLRRCAEPAARLAQTLGARLMIDARLCELSMGAWEGLRWDVIERDDGETYRTWMTEWRERAPPGGESPRDLERRVTAWCHETAPDTSHLLIAHAGVVRALLVVVQRFDWEEAMRVTVPHLEPARLSEFAATARTLVRPSTC